MPMIPKCIFPTATQPRTRKSYSAAHWTSPLGYLLDTSNTLSKWNSCSSLSPSLLHLQPFSPVTWRQCHPSNCSGLQNLELICTAFFLSYCTSSLTSCKKDIQNLTSIHSLRAALCCKPLGPVDSALGSASALVHWQSIFNGAARVILLKWKSGIPWWSSD